MLMTIIPYNFNISSKEI